MTMPMTKMKSRHHAPKPGKVHLPVLGAPRALSKEDSFIRVIIPIDCPKCGTTASTHFTKEVRHVCMKCDYEWIDGIEKKSTPMYVTVPVIMLLVLAFGFAVFVTTG